MWTRALKDSATREDILKSDESCISTPSDKNSGNFEVLSLLGRGGQGEVYRTPDTQLQPDVPTTETGAFESLIVGRPVATRSPRKKQIESRRHDWGRALRQQRSNVTFDLKRIDFYDGLLNQIELEILRHAKLHDANTFHLLDSVPGIGKILALVLLYEIHDISRFPTVQDFVSYCRLVKSKKESAGKIYGSIGTKIGNAHLKWAFSEAGVLSLRNNPPGQAYLARLEKMHSKGKALTILAHKLARAVYYMLRRNEAFDMKRFLNR